MKRCALLILLVTGCVDHKSIGQSPLEESADSSSSSADAEDTAADHTTMPTSGPPATTGETSEICEVGDVELELEHTSACGDLSWVGNSTSQALVDGPPAVTISIRVPSMIGQPFGPEGTYDVTYTLPDPAVEVRALLLAAQDETECNPEGDYDAVAYDLHAVSGTLEVSLIDRTTVGCFFTCADAYARLQNVRFHADECEADAPGVRFDSLELWGDVLDE
ncbi:MAG TPA: hypothetical protein VG755_07490 [Nannocystaceae bacterium]|nr:hypothetical protein [Nannocystaceae bacterium]